MKVIDITKKGKNDNYIVEFDDNSKFLLTLETIIKNHITKNDDISADKFNEILLADQIITGFNKCLDLISKTPKTKKQLKEYLKQKGYFPQAINNVLEKLEKYNYIDDTQYAEMFIQSVKSFKGKLYIKQKLFEKGIDIKIINDLLKDLEPEPNAIENLIDKYMRNKTNDFKTKEKLIRHLLSKGFEYTEINKIISSKLKGIENEDWN